VRSIEFQKFIDLVTFDQSLVKIERDIKKYQEIEQSIILAITHEQDKFLESKHAKAQARKAVDEKELFMKVLDEKATQLKKKLETVASQREAKSLEKEIAALHEEQSLHEQELMNLWNKSENLEKNFQAKQLEHDAAIAQLHEQIIANQLEQKKIQHDNVLLLQERQEKEKNIPQEWLTSYANMQGRVNNPVVPVVNDACDGCFYSITPKDLQVLRQNKLLQCKDCYRLLYINSPKF